MHLPFSLRELWWRSSPFLGPGVQQSRGPHGSDQQWDPMAVRSRHCHHPVQLPAGDPGATAHGRAVYGQQAAAACGPEGSSWEEVGLSQLLSESLRVNLDGESLRDFCWIRDVSLMTTPVNVCIEPA